MRRTQFATKRELPPRHRRVSRTPARCTSASLTSAAHAHSRKVDKRNDLKALLICDENICHLPKHARPSRAYDQHRPSPFLLTLVCSRQTIVQRPPPKLFWLPLAFSTTSCQAASKGWTSTPPAGMYPVCWDMRART